MPVIAAVSHACRTRTIAACLALPGLPLCSHASDLLAADASITLDGDIAGDQFGRSVAILGDVDGDLVPDYAISMRGGITGIESAGRVTIFSGATDTALWSLDGESSLDHFGEEIAAAGDVDNDGVPDLIVGAWNNAAGGSSAGRAYVYSGASAPALYTITGSMPGDTLGDSVAGAGDINNDGFDDLIIGIPTSDTGASNTGSVMIISGIDGSTLYTKHGQNENDRLGVCVAGIGDVDADGFDDFAAGAHLFDDGGPIADNRGQIRVYSGQTGGQIYSLTGEGAGDNFGWAVNAAGDVNADGIPDIVVGAPLNDALGSNTGRVYIYSGPDGALLHTFTGERASDKLGLTVAPAGDIDADGHADVLTGAWWHDEGDDSSDNRGRAYAFSGRTGVPLFTITGEARRDHLGRPVAGAVDINGDGTPDMLIGARDSDSFGEDAGRAYLFYLPEPCRADLTGDGELNFFDITELVALYIVEDPAADFTGDGRFNFFDFSAYLDLFTAGCP